MRKSDYWMALERFDWRAYIEEQGAERASIRRTDEYLLDCPDCGKAKLAINVESKKWRCFVCAQGGSSIVDLIVKIEKIYYAQAVRKILSGRKRAIGQIETLRLLDAGGRADTPRIFSARPMPEGFTPLHIDCPITRQANAYCEERGITRQVALEMGLGATDRGMFRGRLIFPICDEKGRLLFYQGRAMWAPTGSGRFIKTLSPPLEPGKAGAGDVLLNYQRIYRRFERVLIVEGPIDCAHAYPDAVATLGKRINARQIELLLRAGVKAVDLCWDADAEKDMDWTIPQLTGYFVVRKVRLPLGTDPGDLSKAQLDRLRNTWPLQSGGRYRRLHGQLREG